MHPPREAEWLQGPPCVPRPHRPLSLCNVVNRGGGRGAASLDPHPSETSAPRTALPEPRHRLEVSAPHHQEGSQGSARRPWVPTLGPKHRKAGLWGDRWFACAQGPVPFCKVHVCELSPEVSSGRAAILKVGSWGRSSIWDPVTNARSRDSLPQTLWWRP